VTDCTCDLADVSSHPWHPEYVRAEPNGCLIHSTEAELQAKKERDDWHAEIARRREAAMKAAREAP